MISSFAPTPDGTNSRGLSAHKNESGSKGELREAISSEASRLCFETHGESLRAVVLTGSLARDEATLVRDKEGCRLLGDAEFLLIFHDGVALPSKTATSVLCRTIETSVSQQGIVAEIKFSAAYGKYLQRLRPEIFAYELRSCGRVVWGDAEILKCMPRFVASDIALEDGWRLLSNRMIELIMELEPLQKRPQFLPCPVVYRTIKLYLDMATSLLLFAGEYASTYSERACRLRALADAQPSLVPFDLRHFSDRVSECTQLKLSVVAPNRSSDSTAISEHGFSWWKEAVEYAQQLWRWELAFLTGTTGQASSQELLRRWMSGQPAFGRLRGWLYVVRDQGWHQSWKNWPRWTRLAWHASPRYWVYGVASEAIPRLICLLEGANGTQGMDADWERMRLHLPVVPKLAQRHEISDWPRLAKEICWNYEKFLTETRA
jgi:hypothetical protein